MHSSTHGMPSLTLPNQFPEFMLKSSNKGRTWEEGGERKEVIFKIEIRGFWKFRASQRCWSNVGVIGEKGKKVKQLLLMVVKESTLIHFFLMECNSTFISNGYLFGLGFYKWEFISRLDHMGKRLKGLPITLRWPTLTRIFPILAPKFSHPGYFFTQTEMVGYPK